MCIFIFFDKNKQQSYNSDNTHNFFPNHQQNSGLSWPN